MEITQADFRAYESVRQSGMTNMFAVNVVCDLSGLTREQVFAIMQAYSEYKARFA